MAKMGMFGPLQEKHWKRKFRWVFTIPQVTPEPDSLAGANVLPPEKSARPSIQFKEMPVRHLNEDVYYPCKPDWKPVQLTLYDVQTNPHPVFKWVQELYIPEYGDFKEPNCCDFIKEAILRMYDGCGKLLEMWIWEDAWLQSANFQTLDYGDSGIVMVDISLRYARSYVMEMC